MATFQGLSGHMQLWPLMRPRSSRHLRSICVSPSLACSTCHTLPCLTPVAASSLSSVHKPMLYTRSAQSWACRRARPRPRSGPLHPWPCTVPLGCAQWNEGMNMVVLGERRGGESRGAASGLTRHWQMRQGSPGAVHSWPCSQREPPSVQPGAGGRWAERRPDGSQPGPQFQSATPLL